VEQRTEAIGHAHALRGLLPQPGPRHARLHLVPHVPRRGMHRHALDRIRLLARRAVVVQRRERGLRLLQHVDGRLQVHHSGHRPIRIDASDARANLESVISECIYVHVKEKNARFLTTYAGHL